MDGIRTIELKRSVLADNDADAAALRAGLKARGTYLLNLMSSPGSGKTTLLAALAPHLAGKVRWGVMEADIDSAGDAEAIARLGVPAVQLHTGGMCHLDADMTRQGLRALGGDFDLVVLENVGNLVCPAEFDTGAAENMTLLSVPEGDDKPLKYPLMYRTCDLLAVTKTDVEPFFDFDRDRLVRNARARNPDIDILFLSAKTGDGIPALAERILRRVRAWKA